MKTFSLSEFTRFLRRILALNLPEAIWIDAELGQVNSARGHLYLSLIEKAAGESDALLAQVEAILWAGKLRELQQRYGLGIQQIFREGMAVRLRVTADYHDRYGFKLQIQDADPQHTLGQLALQRQAIVEQLRREGLLQINQQRRLSILPQRLAIISSETAAGYADFCRQLAESPFGYRFQTTLFAAAMQGDLAATEISQAIRQISRRSDAFDAICIIRGGGSRLDLLAFDDLALCREVALAPLPVLVGVGHETDEVLLDLVAWKALKTPTAVAVFLLDCLAATEGQLLQLSGRIEQLARYHLAANAEQLTLYRQQLHGQAKQQLQLARQQLHHIEQAIPSATAQSLRQAKDQLRQQQLLLHALRPETSLARGFALLSQEGRIIRLTSDLDRNKNLHIRLQDGETEWEVE